MDELERLQEEAEEEDDRRRASEDAEAEAEAEAEAIMLNDLLFKVDQLISATRAAEAMIKQRELAWERLEKRVEIEIRGKKNVDSL